MSRPASTSPFDDGILDLIERRHHRLEIGLVELEREVGGGERTRDGDALAAHIGARHRRARDEARSIAVAHRRAVRQQRVALGEIGVRVNGDGGHLELRLERALVERLDVLQLVHVAKIARIDLSFGERVEHEGVVGVGAVGDVNRFDGHVTR